MLLLIMFAILFAQNPESENIRNALKDLEETNRSMLLIGILIQGIISIVFLSGAALIYLKKIKKSEKKDMLWLAAAVVLGLIGLFFLLGTIFGVLSYLATPVIIKSITGY